jgi:hypothetical protein
VVVAQFVGAVCEEADERAVDVAEAEEAEVVNVDGQTSRFQSFKVSKVASQTADHGLCSSLKP